MHLLILLLHSTCILSAYYVSRTEEETKEMRLSLSLRICHLTEKAWNKSYLQKQSFVLQREEGWAGGRSPCCLPCLSSWVPWVRAVVRKKMREDGWEALRDCQQLQGEGNGNPLQYSCLENPRDRGAWWATVCGVAQSWTRLKRLSSSAAAAAAASRKSRRAQWRAVNSESNQIFLVRAEWGMVVDYSGWSMLRLKKPAFLWGCLLLTSCESW